MSITVSGRNVSVNDSLRSYAEDKIGSAMKIMDITPLDAEVVLHVEKNKSNPTPCVCEVTLRTKGHIIRVEESEEEFRAAIDVAAAKVIRQMRKYKTKVIDKRQRREAPAPAPMTDLDDLMAELSSDEEVVRIKETEFAPMTLDDALIQIDLLGHDFFAYVDRDTNLVNVLYRRTNGGYGLLKQKA